MNYIIKKAINLNGQDMLLSPLDIDYAHRVISITGAIDEDTASFVNSYMRDLARNSEEDITIYIQSPGGSVSAGMSIYDTAKAVKCDVVTVASGMAASMGAFLLAAAGTKGKRWCQPNAEVLIHQPLGGAQGQASDIMIAAKEIEKTRKELYDIISEHSGPPYEKVFADADRDYWMTSQEAKEYGMIDEILAKAKKK